MWYRLVFLLVTVFFVTMNVLLWRAEIGGRSRLIGTVPAEVIWEKVLTAPDNSALTIERRGVKIGHCTLIPNLGEDRAAGRQMNEEPLPEGMVGRLAGYSLDLDGQLSLDDLTRLRFSLTLKLATNQALEELSLELKSRPDSWGIRAIAATRTLELRKEEGGVRTQKTYALGQPRQWEALMEEMGVPLPPGLLGVFGLAGSQKPKPAALGLQWEAQHDWLELGHSRLRVYHLVARLLDRYQADVYVSHVGEILRLDLPGELSLRNDVLLELP